MGATGFSFVLGPPAVMGTCMIVLICIIVLTREREFSMMLHTVMIISVTVLA